MDGDIFTRAGNRKRTYALASFSVQYRVSGWHFKRTDHDDAWRGPYSNEVSVCLMIGRALCKELKKRDGLPS
jgi:hypothetical protein